MTSPETTQFYDGLPQDNSSQDYSPPPNDQFQDIAPHDDALAPVADYPTKTNPKTYQGRLLEDIFSDFVPFNAVANLKEPWEAESERDDAFIQAQFAEFAEFLIEMWAWHMARVKHATEAGGERLGQRLSETLATEKEQAEMCIRLREFVGQMQSAINALCGF